MEPGERALFRVPLGGDHHEFIDQQRTVSVRNAVAFVERIEFGRIQMPLLKASVERAFIDFAALEVHDFEPDRIGFEPQVDVLADKDDPAALLLKPESDLQNPVVRRIAAEVEPEYLPDLRIHLAVAEFGRAQHEEPPGRARRDGRQRHSSAELPRLARRLAQLVEPADDLPGVASELVGIFLELIELLDHRHRNDDVVVVERFDALRAVQQNIGIQHKGFHCHMSPPSAMRRCGRRCSSIHRLRLLVELLPGPAHRFAAGAHTRAGSLHGPLREQAEQSRLLVGEGLRVDDARAVLRADLLRQQVHDAFDIRVVLENRDFPRPGRAAADDREPPEGVARNFDRGVADRLVRPVRKPEAVEFLRRFNRGAPGEHQQGGTAAGNPCENVFHR